MSLLARRPGADLDAVRVAVGRAVEPEIGRPLAELGLVGEVTAAAGRVTVAVRLIAGEHRAPNCCAAGCSRRRPVCRACGGSRWSSACWGSGPGWS